MVCFLTQSGLYGIATLWHLFKVVRVSRWKLPRILGGSKGGTKDGDLRAG